MIVGVVAIPIILRLGLSGTALGAPLNNGGTLT
jgi:hypothetical protein